MEFKIIKPDCAGLETVLEHSRIVIPLFFSFQCRCEYISMYVHLNVLYVLSDIPSAAH